MKLYEITSPYLALPTFAAGRDVARLVKRNNIGAVIKEVPHPSAPTGCESVEVRGFRFEFLPQTLTRVVDLLMKADVVPATTTHDGYYCVRADRSCLCLSAFVRQQLLRKLTKGERLAIGA